MGRASSPVGRNFVGDFVGGMKRVFGGNRPNRTSSLEEELGGIESAPSPSRVQSPHTFPQPLQQPPSAASVSRRSDSIPDDPTVVRYEPLPDPLPMGSPVYVDPQPGSDYARMDSPSPPPSTASLGSYISRVRKFFQDINELPWVASERVTIDYYPSLGQRASRRRSANVRSPLPHPHRPVVSWYDKSRQPYQERDDLFSSSSGASTVMAEIQIEGSQPLPKNARVVYPALYVPTATLQQSQYPSAPPAPVYPVYPTTAKSYRGLGRAESFSSSYNGASRNAPVYPHGYVPYQQQNAAGVQYAADAIHHMAPAASPDYSVPPAA
jgi:hypothetical protein